MTVWRRMCTESLDVRSALVGEIVAADNMAFVWVVCLSFCRLNMLQSCCLWLMWMSSCTISARPTRFTKTSTTDRKLSRHTSTFIQTDKPFFVPLLDLNFLAQIETISSSIVHSHRLMLHPDASPKYLKHRLSDTLHQSRMFKAGEPVLWSHVQRRHC